MRQKKSALLTPYVLGTCLLTLVACGSNDDDDDAAAPEAPQPEERQEDPGTYRASLATQNGAITGTPTAVVAVSIVADEVTVRLAAEGVKRVSGGHGQHIHSGTACPTPADDTNGDGIIDAVEANAVMKGVLIPLDADLDTQDEGAGKYPDSTDSGLYVYQKSGSYSKLLADLTAPDADSNDEFEKLPAGDLLGLEGRVVEIRGIPEDIILPATVAGLPGHSAQASLPIACGVLERVSNEESTGGTTGPTN